MVKRETGNYLLSIPTDLAIESLMQNVNKGDYGELWVNLRTIIRNAARSLPTESKTLHNVAQAVNADITQLINLIGQSDKGIVLKIYSPTYESLKSLPYKMLREAKTDKQKEAASIENTILKDIKALEDSPIINNDTLLPGKGGDALVLTHYPVDLLSKDKFGQLLLLESQTGKVKDFRDWHSKLMLPKDSQAMPFNICTIIVMGDKSTFSPFNIRVKRSLIDLGGRSGWSAITTQKLMEYNLEKSSLDHLTKQILTEVFRSRSKLK